MSKRVITISREFGSGGRTIAKLIAQNLGWAYYDKELVAKISEKSGLTKEFIEEQGEDAGSRHSFLFNFSLSSSAAAGMQSVTDQLYTLQYKIIEELADQGNCVIVGRCADYILQDRADCLHTFIYADMEFEAKRIVELYGETATSPLKRVREKNDKRRIYYKHYTNRDWGRLENYDIALNSGRLGVENCADIICGMLDKI